MSVYWKDVNRGQNLILSEEEGQEETIGGYRDTKRGIDAYAQTFSYDPGRSQKGFDTIEDAKEFVEAFRPWELHGVYDVTVDREWEAATDSGATAGPDASGQPSESPEPVSESAATASPAPAAQPTEPVVPEEIPRKNWWQFWKKG